uniref:ORF 64a n=1 Tax=Lactococcus phage mv4 TaxID=12392 RepID=Q9G0B8_BPMV4|nr:ORF 64a [Lactobacillus phage mv4]
MIGEIKNEHSVNRIRHFKMRRYFAQLCLISSSRRRHAKLYRRKPGSCQSRGCQIEASGYLGHAS